jgi:hypothetical protein
MSVRTQIKALSSFLPLVMQKLKTKLQKMITCHGIWKSWLQKIAAHEQMRHNWCIWPTWNLSIANWSILMQFAEKSPLKYFEGQANKCHVSSWGTENKQQTSNGCCQTLVSVTQVITRLAPSSSQMAVTAYHLITQPLTSSAPPTSDIDKYITIHSKICICTFYHISRSNGKASQQVLMRQKAQ